MLFTGSIKRSKGEVSGFGQIDGSGYDFDFKAKKVNDNRGNFLLIEVEVLSGFKSMGKIYIFLSDPKKERYQPIHQHNLEFLMMVYCEIKNTIFQHFKIEQPT
ncbi:MAG: hypothetical protein Fur0024_0990 [Patescibacteria group bacterium]